MNLKLEPNSLLFHFYHGNHALVFVWGRGREHNRSKSASRYGSVHLYCCKLMYPKKLKYNQTRKLYLGLSQCSISHVLDIQQPCIILKKVELPGWIRIFVFVCEDNDDLINKENSRAGPFPKVDSDVGEAARKKQLKPNYVRHLNKF